MLDQVQLPVLIVRLSLDLTVWKMIKTFLFVHQIYNVETMLLKQANSVTMEIILDALKIV